MARSSLSRPGRSAARVNSLARRVVAFLGTWWGVVCARVTVEVRPSTKSASLRRRPLERRRPLALGQNGIEPRLKIVFSLAPQFAALHRQSRLDRLHPAE